MTRHLPNRLASLLLTATLAGCATGTTGSRAIAAGTPFALAPGAAATLPDASRLRFVAVTADSRCPTDVQCIRAGDADLAFEFTPAAGKATGVTVNTDAGAPVAIGVWQLTLLSLGVGEAPAATLRVDPR